MIVVLEGPVFCDRTVIFERPMFYDCGPRRACGV